ncbi:dihydrolipoyllysine-residue acetyltransferase component of pyruvate dehydrogenase complex [Microbulbifer aestuariivivens]|uniref:Dihydrolipoamide acetyltransferase component of pyruvate dehydrogenase complex n=1 Tax=Microbulbifer aestuariivivens TaxID=1908308 RepID=A0ABP9WQU4_9GAMM
MKIFKLPDLGEGLPDAVIREWHVAEGDRIAAHAPLVTVETAKALVEVPAPWSGRIARLFAAVDETVPVDGPLVGFAEDSPRQSQAAESPGLEAIPPCPESPPEASPQPAGQAGAQSALGAAQERRQTTRQATRQATREGTRGGTREGTAEETTEAALDAGSVVGRIQAGTASVEAEQAPQVSMIRRATPSVRALARLLHVDLKRLTPAGERISAAEVRAAASAATLPEEHTTQPSPHLPSPSARLSPGPPQSASARKAEEVSAAPTQPDNVNTPARRAMALVMARSRDQVAPVTLQDTVDVHRWWGRQQATLRLIRAIEFACATEPTLNALYEDDRLLPAQTLNIGLAVDSPRGLFVPVLRNVSAHSDEELRQQIAAFKRGAQERGIDRADLQGASILLSNFGALGGCFATPVVMPPTVAIVGAGRVIESVVPVAGRPAIRPMLPLSVSADHRAVTGGELARFLAALQRALSA